MGTNYTGEGSNGGIIPKVMESIFRKVEAMKDSSEFLIRVSFIEVADAYGQFINFSLFQCLNSFAGCGTLMTDIQGRSV